MARIRAWSASPTMPSLSHPRTAFSELCSPVFQFRIWPQTTGPQAGGRTAEVSDYDAQMAQQTQWSGRRDGTLFAFWMPVARRHSPRALGGTGLCPMNAEEVRNLMRQLAGGVGQPSVASRCDCENLDTAYVAVDEGGKVRVTDDRRTFQYSDERTDSTYVPLQSLDLAAAPQVCRELRVELRSAPPNG